MPLDRQNFDKIKTNPAQPTDCRGVDPQLRTEEAVSASYASYVRCTVEIFFTGVPEYCRILDLRR